MNWILFIVFLLTNMKAANAENTLTLTRKTSECLVANRAVYEDIPRVAISFFPALCPRVDNSDIASLSLNSSGSSEDVKRVLILKPTFACLVENIKQILDDPGSASQAEIEVSLDC